MASIIKKIKKGHPYYYAVQSARVDGKPRIVWQKYLGTIEAIVQRTELDKIPKRLYYTHSDVFSTKKTCRNFQN